MQLWQLLLVNLAAVMSLMLLVWLASVPLRNASIVDIFWGLGFVAVGWLTFVLNRSASLRPLVLVVAITLWGLRLAGYLAWRNIGKGEDYRYAAMRKYHGKRFWWVSLLTVFVLQGAVMWIVSLPVQVGQLSEAGLNWLDALGLAIWVVGLTFETVGDIQLARFKADPANAGKVMNRGLWRYTRHPNYFGDFCVWWGIFLIAAAGGQAWWTIVSPLLMSFFLLRVSGVTLLENSLRERRAGYEEYIRTTSAFFPWPPRQTTDRP